jgi:hypothetical protein
LGALFLCVLTFGLGDAEPHQPEQREHEPGRRTFQPDRLLLFPLACLVPALEGGAENRRRGRGL